MKSKNIKDAVHGYISIEKPFWTVIDTPEFQRLKWIEQTSFRILYPSARHDRFVHSIGTFHLGKIAVEGLSNNLKDRQDSVSEILLSTIEENRNSFLFACLLHDIGHAPFSHSCENLFNYLEEVTDKESKINRQLYSSLSNSGYIGKNDKDSFIYDYEFIINEKHRDTPPKPHEIMSAIVIIENYGKLSSEFSDENKPDLDLVIRSILGCVYPIRTSDSIEEKSKRAAKNCLIRLLNSSSIDVDKLDYFARDSAMSGYDTVVLDNQRLLNSVTIVRNDEQILPAFRKSILSVLNSVIDAKNAQTRWIIKHPVVVYEEYILTRAIGLAIKSIYDGNQLKSSEITSESELIGEIFSLLSLSLKGHSVGNLYFRLLSDVEIIGIMKKSFDIPEVIEWFCRNNRRKPIWKSINEYIYCFKDRAEDVAAFLRPLITYSTTSNITDSHKIDDESYQKLVEKKETIAFGDEILRRFDILKEYCQGRYEFDFVIIPVSSMSEIKLEWNKILIQFGPNIDDCCKYSIFQSKDTPHNPINYDFFYMYSRSKLDLMDFSKYILSKAQEVQEYRC